ncbi:Terpenoid synthase [Mycena sanguinolenta]|uniref:Terpenoid synthase n=1 Tax=Mycena sanguinolenta TaxID=230812 RepID=A0A8H6ZDA0_9AGAR|nr:Terpenoid synthase [Mycena sanguinolenta]
MSLRNFPSWLISVCGSRTPQEDARPDLRGIIGSLLNVVSYTPSNNPHVATSTTDALEKALVGEVESWDVDDGHDGAQFASISKKAVSLIQFWYSRHSFDEKFTFALYAFFFYIDDCVGKPGLDDYQRRLMMGLPQVDPVLTHYQRVLGKLYDHWDPISADAMVCAAMEFMNGSILENRHEIMGLTVAPTAPNWPKYLRAKSGLGSGAAFAIFPKQAHPDISAYIQVVPDIDEFTCLANDILSFYKEELAGETTNYVHFRSRTTSKPPKQVLAEMVREASNLHVRIAATLARHPEALAAWRTFENGFIAWHLSIKRYKLSELGFQYLKLETPNSDSYSSFKESVY